jgi:hypothetical protein
MALKIRVHRFVWDMALYHNGIKQAVVLRRIGTLTMTNRFVPTRPAALILTLLLLALPVTPLQPPDNKQESTLPYIYYYADTLKRVIERGRHSRILTELPYH